MGLVNLAEGNYSEATKSLSGYNLAVAEVMNGNLSKAKSLLANENSADADYLKAVIAMREGNTSSAISNLKSAIAKDPAKKDQAVKDIEFSKLFERLNSSLCKIVAKRTIKEGNSIEGFPSFILCVLCESREKEQVVLWFGDII